MRRSGFLGMLLLSMGLGAVALVSGPAQGSQASGGGTYFVEPGVRSEFQFSPSHVQCKIGQTVFPDGTALQMLMFSTSIDSASVVANTVAITGSMVSIVKLRFPDGTAVTLSESVPFVAYGEDNGTPGAGADFFSLTVQYADTPGLDQFDLFAPAFGNPTTFGGTLATGKVAVR